MSRKPRRFFWRWSDGEYVYTGMYLWRGYFGGVVRLAGREGKLLLDEILLAAAPTKPATPPRREPRGSER